MKTWAVSCTEFPDHERIVAAPTAGQAKYRTWLDIQEPWPDTPITSMRARLVREYLEPPGFRDCVERRGVGFARIGMKVLLGDERTEGRIVGHNDSSNLDVQVGRRVYNVHPLWKVTYLDEAGQEIPLPANATPAAPLASGATS